AEQLREARTCVRDSDFRGLRRIAHSLKSSAASFGATSLRDAASAVENVAIETTAAGLTALIGELEAAFAPVGETLAARRAVCDFEHRHDCRFSHLATHDQ